MEAQEGPTGSKGKRKRSTEEASCGIEGKKPAQSAPSAPPGGDEVLLHLGEVKLEVLVALKDASGLKAGAAVVLKHADAGMDLDDDEEQEDGDDEEKEEAAEGEQRASMCLELLSGDEHAGNNQSGAAVVPLQHVQPFGLTLVTLLDHGVVDLSFRVSSLAQAAQDTVTVVIAAEVKQSIDPHHPFICRFRNNKGLLNKALSLYHHLMRPPTASVEGGAPLRLVEVFEEMTASDKEVKGDQRRRKDRRNSIIAQCLEQQQQQADAHSRGLVAVSDEVLGLIFSFFQPRDLSALGHTSRFLHEACSAIVPGLRARLYPHQRRCLDWMLEREEARPAASAFPHPAYRPYVCTDGREVHVDLVTGHVALTPAQLPVLMDCRGGMLCDEPGLGKTVTALALILARRGMLPATPGLADSSSSSSSHPGKRRFNFRSADSRRREVDPCGLISSPATLVIVPGPLLPHWREQIERHAEPWALRRVYYESDGPGEAGEGGGGGGGRRRLPPAEVLSQYDVVVLSRERLSVEWNTGKPPCALEARVPWRFAEKYEDAPSADKLSELLRVHWLRIIVDEGHALGSVAVTNAALMALCIEAERRWVMTGTPTRHDANDMRSLLALLAFLREGAFGPRDGSGEQRFSSLITRAPHLWLARDRLRCLLRRIMIRHTKACIPEIPKPILRHRRLRMSPLEARTYNNFVALVHANLITTGMVGGSHRAGAEHPDSLLNPRNQRLALTTMENLRLACCGGGLQQIELTQHNFVETLNLTREFGGGAKEQAKVVEFMRRARDGRLSECERCHMRTSLMLVTPYCFHLVCGDCMEGRNNVCGHCGRSFSVDDFQLYQPGFSMRWKEFELQVVDGMRVLKPLDVAREEDDEHDDGSWDVMSKVKHILEVLRDYQADLDRSSASSSPPSLRPLKALVFSQFKSNLHCMSAALKSQGLGVAEFYGNKRAAHLEAFVHNPDVHVLLSGREGSHGLDLSFLTHIFLFDQIWDAGLEDQVISRAYRMGARAPVIVEKLMMVGSVEEVMHGLRGGAHASGRLLEAQQAAASSSSSAAAAAATSPSSSSSSSAAAATSSGPSSSRPAKPKKPPRSAWLFRSRRKSGASSPTATAAPAAHSQQARDLSKLHYLLQRLVFVRGADAIRPSKHAPVLPPADEPTATTPLSPAAAVTPRQEGTAVPAELQAQQQQPEVSAADGLAGEEAPARRVRFVME